MEVLVKFEDDVAAEIERLQHETEKELPEVVNEVLRAGFPHVRLVPPDTPPYVTPVHDNGVCLLSNLDNIGEVLALIEDEKHR